MRLASAAAVVLNQHSLFQCAKINIGVAWVGRSLPRLSDLSLPWFFLFAGFFRRFFSLFASSTLRQRFRLDDRHV